MMIAVFDNMDSFNSWHTLVKQALGIPRPNVGYLDGQEKADKTWTLEYTRPMLSADGEKVLAFIGALDESLLIGVTVKTRDQAILDGDIILEQE